MTSDPTTELARLGDDLERAASRQLHAGRRRARTLRAAAGLAIAAVLLTATAAAAGLFTPAQVAAGLPASAVIFGGTHPACALDADGSTYHCTLDVAPQSDVVGFTPDPAVPGKADSTAASDDGSGNLGRKEPIAIGGVVAGGCVGRSADGLHWDCYLGTDAVTQGIVTQDFLGEPMDGPGRG